MNLRNVLLPVLLVLVLNACTDSGGIDPVFPTPPTTTDDGDVVTGIITAEFDPTGGVIPFPNSLLLLGTTDITLNIPVADPTNFGDPSVALNALDGFSTVSPWTTTFSAPIDPSTVIPGSSVRAFEVTVAPGTPIVTGITRELVPGVDFVATVSGDTTLTMVPLKPLDQLTSYMVMVLDDIQDADGNDSTPSAAYFIAKRTEPLIDATGASTDPALDDATAQALEPLRVLVSTQEAVFSAFTGIPVEEVVVSFNFPTQSITPVQSVVQSLATPMPIAVGPTGLTTADVLPPGASPGIADVFVGTIDLPYYLGVPSAENPIAPLTDFWTASPGAFVPPFSALGLDPTSTNVTVANPVPVLTDIQTVPVLVTVPNAASGLTRPPEGWPVAIFMHGITGNRSNMLALADTYASIGFVAIAIDQVLHGITDPTSPLFVENTPFGPIANERTFDLDVQDNATGASGPDGLIDSSGTFFVNLGSLLTSRDNNRQSIADLSTLAVSAPFIDLNGDGITDIDGSQVLFSSQSLGSIVGIPFLAVEPTVNVGALSVPGGGIANLLAGSPTFGPSIAAGLQAAAGIEPGSADFFAFLAAAQAVIDSADPINWVPFTVASNALIIQTVIGDQVIPNTVAGAPLSGGFPLAARFGEFGVPTITSTLSDPMGVQANITFLPPASHGSVLSPASSPAATVEMQSQFASLLASGGTTVVISNPDILQD